MHWKWIGGSTRAIQIHLWWRCWIIGQWIDDDETYGDNEFRPGDVVWAKYTRIWYPAKVCRSSDIPQSLKNKLKQSKTLFPIMWYVENKHSLVQIRNIDQLAQNRVDECRASVSEDILMMYNEALPDLRNDYIKKLLLLSYNYHFFLLIGWLINIGLFFWLCPVVVDRSLRLPVCVFKSDFFSYAWW